MTISITGIGWFGPAGPGRGREKVFSPQSGTIPAVPRRSVFSRPYLHFGRMDLYSRLGVAAVALALRDAGVEDSGESRPFGLVSSTLYGCLTTDTDFYETVMDKGGGLASPQLFAYTLSNTFVGEAAIRFGFTGPTYTIYEEPLTGMESLRAAFQSIVLGETDTVIAGLCDLGWPDGLPLRDTGPTGALFVVLQERPSRTSAYGEIALAGTKFVYNEAEIKTLFALAEMLTGRHNP